MAAMASRGLEGTISASARLIEATGIMKVQPFARMTDRPSVMSASASRASLVLTT